MKFSPHSITTMPAIPSHTPIAVIGAGPVGVLCALLLAKQGKQVLLIEARPAGAMIQDQRTLALSFNSIRAFSEAGVIWPEPETTPINQVHISQQHHPGRTLLRAEDMGTDHLGQTCDYASLIRSCEAALNQADLSLLWQTRVRSLHTLNHFAELEIERGNRIHNITTDWVILAEGGFLTGMLPGIRQRIHDYRQSALVASLEFDVPQNGIAYERFSDKGPLALLPHHKTYRLVWTRSHEDAQRLQNAGFEEFATEFAQSFGNRAGKLLSCSKRTVFPLQLKQLNKIHSGRIICIGNAAQTMHPVAAQGLNLGVRDAVSLARHFAEPNSLKNSRLAEKYAAGRRLDVQATVGFTHSLVTVFDHPNTLLRLGKSSAMSMLDSIPAWRRAFTEHLIFGL